MNAELIETLAELEHEQWLSWARAVWDEVSVERREKWSPNMVSYAELSEGAKDQDREWARRRRQSSTCRSRWHECGIECEPNAGHALESRCWHGTNSMAVNCIRPGTARALAMVSSDYYRNQARVFMEWAERSDAQTAAQLRKRAEEYLILAKALDEPEASLPRSPPSAEFGSST